MTAADHLAPGDDAEIEALLNRASEARLEQLPALSAIQRRMERLPQLSSARQTQLVLDYQAGLAAKAKLDQKRATKAFIDPREERRLSTTHAKGEAALESVVGALFRLVMLMARERAERRFGRERALDMMPDLVSEGLASVVKAAKDYRPSMTPTFDRYAAQAVRRHISMLVSRETSVKVPASWARIRRIYATRYPKLADRLGRTPTDDEVKADLLAYCMGWAAERLSEEEKALPPSEQQELNLRRLRKQGMMSAIAHIDEVRAYTQQLTSLDAPVGEDGGATYGDRLAGDDLNADVLESVATQQMRVDIMSVLAGLTDRERDIMMKRNGFEDGRCWTFAEIAKVHGVSSERVRQIEAQVTARLRAPGGPGAWLAKHLPSHYDED